VTAEVSPAVYNFDIFYLNLNGGQVRRIQYGNAPPEAQAAVFPTSGNPPLTVQFSSDGTFDSRNRAMTLLWEFGDGTTSNTANPQHTYVTLCYLLLCSIVCGQ
jgi:PKD repeat protein